MGSSFNYNRSGDIIEIIVRDFSGAKIDIFKFKVRDKNKANYVFKTLKKKYNLDIGKKSDLDWIR